MSPDDPRPERPEYKVYRSRPKLGRRARKSDVRSLHRSKRGGRGGGGRGIRDRLPSRGEGGGERHWGRWILYFVIGWTALSFLAFAVSAQIQKGKLDDNAGSVLSKNPFLVSGQTILVLGGDQRGHVGRNEPGSNDQLPPRADTIMLIRTGFGSMRKLSIPRDSYAEIPGFGPQKINAGFALGDAGSDGNTKLMVQAVEKFMRINVDHVIIVNFDGFVEFINALGGVTVDLPHKVCAEISGGRANGGQTIHLGPGEHTLQGGKALALARIRKNDCAPAETDLARAARQQLILAGIKNRLTDPLRLPINFLKGPIIGWTAPKAIVSDMGMFTMPQLAFDAMLGGGGSKTSVLIPSGPGPGGSLIISKDERRRKANRLLHGN